MNFLEMFCELNPDECKALYKQLAMKHHPDRGGSTEVMQLLNAAYEAALKGNSGKKDVSTGRTYQYDPEIESVIVSLIDKLMALPDLEIDLIGAWVWVGGNTYAVKDAIKALGFKWHKTRKLWFFPVVESKGGNSKLSLEELAIKYGRTKVVTEKQKILA